jgi:aryl-alcohol dehydrogenase-like predicted oxidoreductase
MEMTMLGRTGLQVSRLGVGLAEISQMEGSSGTDTVGRILNAALDAGINFLDTAECYGNSEELLGNTVSHRRSEFVLATKAGHVSSGLSGTPWTGQTVRENVDRSLKLMKTDYVDLVQLHAFDVDSPPPDDVVEALLEARDAGKTRFVGFSQENEEAEWAIESGIFDTLQTTFSLLDQGARYGLFERAKAQGVGIIGKRPIANALWGKAAAGEPGGYLGVGVLLYERAKAMLEIGPLEGAPDDHIELALGFVFAHPEVHTAIVGTRNPAHMLSNVETVEKRLPISEDVVAELHRRYDQVGRGWPGIDVVR